MSDACLKIVHVRGRHVKEGKWKAIESGLFV